MRNSFVQALVNQAEKNPDIFLITGDLGFMALESFRDKFPERYLNAGISEQNITGVAAGLAISGKMVFIYSIIPFVTSRNLEFIINDIAAHNLNVKIVGIGAGYSYSFQGESHSGKIDLALLRSIPNLKIVAPGDPWEVQEAVKAITADAGPAYLRLGRQGEPILHQKGALFKLGRGIIMKNGSDLTLIATSNMLESAVKITDKLTEQGLSVRLISMHTLKPLDQELILDSARKTRGIFTLEEHYTVGGLGTAVAEVLSESRLNPVFKRFGLPDRFDLVAGSRQWLRARAGISERQVAAKISQLLKTS